MARAGTGGTAGSLATTSKVRSGRLLVKLGRLFAGWVLACMGVVYLLSAYASAEAAAPIVSLLDSLTLLLPVPMLVAAAMVQRHGANVPVDVLFAWLLGLALPLNIATGLIVLPEVAFGADHAFLFPGFGVGDWRLSPGIIEILTLATVVPVVVLVHFLVQRRVVGQLSAEIAVEKERTREAELARQVVEARLAALQAQIEPHFLYNTLANVQYLVSHDAQAAEQMLMHLVRYLKESVPAMRGRGSTLEQEFAQSASYLEIARIRLGNRLTVRIDLPPAMRSTPFPPTVIQTLVENAVKHGIERKPGPASVAISACETDDEIRVEVADDGAGFGSTASGTGLGIKNVRERLRALYGDDAKLTLSANAPTGVRARVAIPKRGQSA